MLGDHGFERTFAAQCGRILGAQKIQMRLGLGFFQTLRVNESAELADLLGDSADALADRFEFKRKLAALSAEGFDLHVGIGNFGLETASFLPSNAADSNSSSSASSTSGAFESVAFGLRDIARQERTRA